MKKKSRSDKKSPRPVLSDPREPIRFFLNFEPDIPTLTHQQGIKPFVRKDGKPGIRKTRELETLEYFYKQKLTKFVPPTPLVGSVLLKTTWFFNGGEKCSDCIWRIKKPDSDNVAKTLKDCMTSVGFWQDDKQCQDIIYRIDVPPQAKHGILIEIVKPMPVCDFLATLNLPIGLNPLYLKHSDV